mgnify:FL=1
MRKKQHFMQYNRFMRRFFYPKAKFPSVKQSKQTIFHGFIATLIIISIVLPQIMTMEKFILQSPNDVKTGLFIAVTSIISGIIALPYLMRIALSPLFRLLSAVSGVYFCILWAGVGIWVAITNFTPGIPLYGGLSDHFPENIIFYILVTVLVVVLSAIWRLRKDIR